MPENWEINWKDYYRILQVHPTAEQEVVKAAYDKLARKYHPDMNQSPSSTQKMKDINEAYEILSNLEKRRVYHQVYLQYESNPDNDRKQKAQIKPKPQIKPSLIQFTRNTPGRVGRAKFIINNTGGDFSKIYLSNPSSWIKIIKQTSLVKDEKLPLEVQIEVIGEEWGKTYVDNIIVKLDDVESHVRIELQTLPEPKQEKTDSYEVEPIVSTTKNKSKKPIYILSGIIVACLLGFLIYILPTYFKQPSSLILDNPPTLLFSEDFDDGIA